MRVRTVAAHSMDNHWAPPAQALDTDVPGQPVFGLYPIGAGSIEVIGIAFTDLTNTRSISAGTLTLAYWDELQRTFGESC